MNTEITNIDPDYNLIIGQLVIENIENKKNRNKPLDRHISALQKEVVQNPEKWLNKEAISSYKKLIEISKSKDKPAPELLIDLIIQSGRLPMISRVVDCMNIISIETGLTISIWNKDKIIGDITYRVTTGGEKYWPFMGEETALKQGELAAFDNEKVLCLVRYRDSKYAPVELETKNIVVHIQGVYNITRDAIQSAIDQLEELLLSTVGGNSIDKQIFQ